MKLNEKNTDTLRAKDVGELKSMIVDLQKKLLNFRFQKAAKKTLDTSSLRHNRRQVARIKTIIREKETAQYASSYFKWKSVQENWR